MHKCSTCRIQKRAVDSLELELQVFGRTGVLLTAEPISPAPFLIFFFLISLTHCLPICLHLWAFWWWVKLSSTESILGAGCGFGMLSPGLRVLPGKAGEMFKMAIKRDSPGSPCHTLPAAAASWRLSAHLLSLPCSADIHTCLFSGSFTAAFCGDLGL